MTKLDVISRLMTTEHDEIQINKYKKEKVNLTTSILELPEESIPVGLFSPICKSLLGQVLGSIDDDLVIKSIYLCLEKSVYFSAFTLNAYK